MRQVFGAILCPPLIFCLNYDKSEDIDKHVDEGAQKGR